MTDENSTAATSSSPSPPSILLPNLPNDVALQCIARVPISHHPILSLVSKSWRSTVKSPLLYTTRSLLNSTQHLLYLNIRINSTFHWYNRWEMGPKMRVCREFAAAGAINGKIYVMGGCLVDNWARSMNWAEVFDPVEGLWCGVPSPIEVRDKWMHASAVIGDRMYAMADRGGVVYDAVVGEWGGVSTGMDMGWRGRAAVVDGVLYCYDYLGRIRGYDVEEDEWKELEGVGKGLPKFLCGATMANVGGKLFVVWEGKGSGKEMEIMCAEIEVRKEMGGMLSGSIVWSDVILVVPNRSSIVHCAAVGL